jgi:hypothetical protein
VLAALWECGPTCIDYTLFGDVRGKLDLAEPLKIGNLGVEFVEATGAGAMHENIGRLFMQHFDSGRFILSRMLYCAVSV